jgi:hypothetical protein
LWLWVLGGVALWFVLGAVVALTIGRGVRIADQRSPLTGVSLATPGPVTAPVRVRRRPVPLPPVGVGLIVVALLLEGAGYVTRLNGSRGPLAQVLSMDAPLSAPRMFVAGLFAVAAVAAVAGAGVQRGRRTWWLAIGIVAAGIASVKAGGTVHARLGALVESAVGTTATVLLSSLLAASVLGALAFLSRGERRDRRRLLWVLAFYGVAVVGLSAVSGAVAGAFGGGSSWAAMATFVEESCEALAGVAFLVAVLVGVAPQLVLDASALRRTNGAARS